MATLSPKLAAIRTELDAATATMHRIVDPLDDDAWRHQPAPGRWSAADCVEHLNMSSRALIPRLRESFCDARERGWTRPSARLDFFGWFLTRSLEPPPRARFKTNEPFQPTQAGSREEASREFDALQGEIAVLLSDANELSLTRVRITSPFNARIRYNAYSALRITLAHQRRHLWQAAQALTTTAPSP
jgi:hypothetical protein